MSIADSAIAYVAAVTSPSSALLYPLKDIPCDRFGSLSRNTTAFTSVRGDDFDLVQL